MADYSCIEHQQEYKGETIIIRKRNHDGVRTFEWGNIVFYTMDRMKAYIDRIKNYDGGPLW